MDQRRAGRRDADARAGRLIPLAGVAGGMPTASSYPVAAIPLAGVTGPMASGPMQLSYAAPTITELPIIGHDEGPFMKVGKQFKLPTGPWTGISIASPKAFYLLKNRKLTNSYAYGAGGTGWHADRQRVQQGRRFADLRPQRSPPSRTHSVRSQGQTQRRECDRPSQGIDSFGQNEWLEQCCSRFGGRRQICFESRTLHAPQKSDSFWLAAARALDQEVVATAAPIYGNAYGRPFEEIGKTGPSTAKRIIYAVIGILVFILFVFIRVMANNH